MFNGSIYVESDTRKSVYRVTLLHTEGWEASLCVEKSYSRFSEVSRREGRNNGVMSGQWRNILLKLKFYDQIFQSLTMATCRPFYSKRHLEGPILSGDLTLTATYFKN